MSDTMLQKDWNNSGLVFKDISAEQYRIYTFPGGEKVVVNEPLFINISSRGSHRIVNNEGHGFYIPRGFLMIEWVPKPGKPSFDF